ncbi:MAG: hypothetical protein ACEPOZ_03455 [Marinifilaceae bacterium]
MKKGLLITICTIVFIGCNKKESNENFEQLKEEFHGKYELISSVSKDSIDLNMDGTASTNLLLENPQISNSSLEIRILNDQKQLFEEKWPVETILTPSGGTLDPGSYHSSYSILYALYINPFTCRFDDDFKSIHLLEDIRKNSTNTLISIESIIIEGNKTIKVTTIRKLYTKKGWITTKIESRYKRYTIIT